MHCTNYWTPVTLPKKCVYSCVGLTRHIHGNKEQTKRVCSCFTCQGVLWLKLQCICFYYFYPWLALWGASSHELHGVGCGCSANLSVPKTCSSKPAHFLLVSASQTLDSCAFAQGAPSPYVTLCSGLLDTLRLILQDPLQMSPPLRFSGSSLAFSCQWLNSLFPHIYAISTFDRDYQQIYEKQEREMVNSYHIP